MRLRFFSLPILFLLLSNYSYADTVLVTVSSIKPERSGQILLGVFKNGKFYQEPSMGLSEDINGTHLKIPVNLPAGRYAIVVFHDEDGSGKITRNILKIPTEGYGFSNNKYGIFGPPTFEETAFSVPETTTLEIHLKY